jgi:L-ascorbate metabolism protein UlaG (beta-lactamase superfamily)
MEKYMKVTWLTQAGLLFENEKITVLVDPFYYVNSSNRESIPEAMLQHTQEK